MKTLLVCSNRVVIGGTMFENILKYQKLDLQLIRLEKKLNESTNKKVISEMVALVKELQGKTVKLENDAKIALKKIDELKMWTSQTKKLNP